MRLHKDKGLNPRIGVCECCGKDISVIMMGAHDKMYECRNCGTKLVGRRDCPKCKTHIDPKPLGIFPERGKIPNGLCEQCEADVVMQNEVVKAGGIYWKCENCGRHGAIRAGHPLSKQIRNQMKIKAPNPVGVKFDKHTCPVCTKQVAPPKGC